MIETKPFRILDLPAELRTLIFTFHCQEDEPIMISTFDRRAVRRFGIRKKVVHEETRWLFDPERSVLAILNRQISAESLPIMYGDNAFDFDTMGTLGIFLARSPAAAKFLRNISITGLSLWSGPVSAKIMLAHDRSFEVPVDIATTIKTLTSATHLQSLTLHHESFYVHALSGQGKIRVVDFVRELMPLLQAWQAENPNKSVVGLVKVAEFEYCVSCGEKASECKDWPPQCWLKDVPRRGSAHLPKVALALEETLARELGVRI